MEYVESKADDSNSTYSKIAGDFVTAKKNVIVTSGTLPAIACKEATKTGNPPIPVVYAAVGNPEGSQLRPGHMTGGWNQQASDDMVQARMNHLIAEWNKNPKNNPIGTLGVVYNNLSPPSFTEAGAAIAAAGAAGIPNVQPLQVNTKADIAALPTGVDAYYVCSDPLVTEFIDDIPAKFAAHAFAEHCDDHSGACSVGPNLRDMFATAGTYVSLILSAATPAARSALAGKLPVFTGAIEHRPKDKVKSKGKGKGATAKGKGKGSKGQGKK
jgi:ABC-type uncharacterized transport system substrate-binding protein